MGNEVLVRDYFRLAEARDWARLGGLLHDEFLVEGPTEDPLDRDEFIALHAALGMAFPDWRFNESQVVARGDRVATAIHVTGTHTGFLHLPMLGVRNLPATNLPIHLPVERPVFSFRDGQIAEMRFETVPGGGVMGILAQIGVKVPAPAG